MKQKKQMKIPEQYYFKKEKGSYSRSLFKNVGYLYIQVI